MRYEFCRKYTVRGEIGISGEHSDGRLFLAFLWSAISSLYPVLFSVHGKLMERIYSWVGCVSVDLKQHKYVMAKNHIL